MIIKLIQLFITYFIVFTGFDAIAQNGSKEFTMEDFVNYKFSQKSLRGLQSMNDGENYTILVDGRKIAKMNYRTGDTVNVVFDLGQLGNEKFKSITDYQFSSDETCLMFYLNKDRIFRYSFTANYYVYNLNTKILVPVSVNGKQQLATFSPDGSKVAFVRQNNLFIKDLVKNKEIQVSYDGNQNEVINGAPDWVYEEEFGFSRAYEWSPDSRYIAFMRFDESRVPGFNMTMYGGMSPTLKDNALYPENRVFKYPKAGENNSVVTIHVYDLKNETIKKMDAGKETDQYIPRIKWTKDQAVICIFRLNRLQNKFELLFADADTGDSKVIYFEENKYYIDEDVLDNVRFLDDRSRLIITGEKDGWNHIYLYDFTNSQLTQVTNGSWDVTKLAGIDEKNKIIYYESAESSPTQRDVYSVRFNGKDKKKLSPEAGYNHGEFSEGFRYFINSCSNVNKPSVVTLYDSRGKQLRIMEDNSALCDTLKYYRFNFRELFTFRTVNNVELYGWMIKPPGFDPVKKYPVFMTQYSGPNSQQVTNSWGLSWENYIAQKGYIIVCVDGRGTAARGEAFRKITYLQLGKYELADQIETAKYLGTLPFVDKTRIGIWGWSYGGFITALCMVKGEGLFKAGIAVAPVTNWRYYDNIYTERFMQTPDVNPDGYDMNSPLNFADSLKGKLLICHGTADDNVHLQNTMEFTERLVQAGKQFEMQLYTNRNHNISGGNTRNHLFTRMTNFILENL